MTYAVDVKVLEEQWSRRIAAYSDTGENLICSVWADEALTGWVLYVPSPVIAEFKGSQALAVSLASWMMIKALSDETVTPFRIVAKGKTMVVKGYLPHIALKHAIRCGADDRTNILIPLSGMKPVVEDTSKPYHGKERKKR